MDDRFLLIGYPHGLGDIIMLTPVLRQLYQKKVDVHLAVGARIIQSGILDHCPYVGQLHAVPDTWRRVGCASRMFKEVSEAELRELGASMGRKARLLWPAPGHRVLRNLGDMGLDVEDYRTELFVGLNDVRAAEELMEKLGLRPGAYGFVQSQSLPGPHKNLPPGWGALWLKKRGLRRVVEVGVDWDPRKVPVNAQFLVMQGAAGVVLIDSCFYHAAGAMGKPVDLFFCRRRILDTVRNLRLDAREQVIHDLSEAKRLGRIG